MKVLSLEICLDVYEYVYINNFERFHQMSWPQDSYQSYYDSVYFASWKFNLFQV